MALNNSQIYRSLWHCTAGAILPVAYIFILSRPAMAIVAIIIALLIFTVDFIRIRNPRWSKRMVKLIPLHVKPSEVTHLSRSTWLALGFAVCVLAFQRDIVILSGLFLAWGDPIAALVGKRWGRHKLPVVKEKSWEGSLASLALCLFLGAALTFGPETRGMGLAFGVAAIGALAFAVTEALPIPLDDNFYLPVITGAMMQAVVAFGG